MLSVAMLLVESLEDEGDEEVVVVVVEEETKKGEVGGEAEAVGSTKDWVVVGALAVSELTLSELEEVEIGSLLMSALLCSGVLPLPVEAEWLPSVFETAGAGNIVRIGIPGNLRAAI